MNIDKDIARKLYKDTKPMRKAIVVSRAIRKKQEKDIMRASIEEQINQRIKQKMVEELEYQNVLSKQEQEDQKLQRRIATLEIEKRMQEKQIKSGSFFVPKTNTLRDELISSIDEKIRRLKL